MASQSAAQQSDKGLLAMIKGKQPISMKSHQLAVETSYKQHENGSSEALFSLVPGPGTHYFRYHGAWIQVSVFFPLHLIQQAAKRHAF
jgi:chaperone BCS1